MNDTYTNVWDAIEETPAAAEHMKMRSALMSALRDYLKTAGLTQKEAAVKLGVTQPRVSDLMRGKIDLFAVESLVTMLASVGMQVAVKVKKAA